MTQVKWHTDEEMGYIAETMDQPRAAVAEALNRTANQVTKMRRAVRLGERRKKEPWTPDEDRIILEAVSADGRILPTAGQMKNRLPGRTAVAIKRRRQALDVLMPHHFQEANPYAVAHRPLLAKTCPKCGLLLPAGWFGFSTKNRRWQADCRKCSAARLTKQRQGWQEPEKAIQREKSRAYYDAAQKMTKDRASRNGYPYTEADHKVLSSGEITRLGKALLLGRTFASVCQQTAIHGYKSHVGLGDPERDRWVIENPNEARATEIASLIKLGAESRPAWDWDD